MLLLKGCCSKPLVGNFIFLIVTIGFCFSSCADDEAPQLQITSIEPNHGTIGSVIRVKGTGFKANSSEIKIHFFDGIEAQISRATMSELEVVVPIDAVTGPVSVFIDQKTVSSKQDFVITPMIEGFTPVSALAGSVVTITGTGFSSTAANNEVKFNNVPATVQNATSTSLTVVAPNEGSNGKISVLVGTELATSVDNFIFVPKIESISPTVGAVNRIVTIQGSGFNIAPSQNTVSFNGVVSSVISSNSNTISVAVPTGATSGNVSLTTSNNIAIGPQFNVVVEAMYAGGSGFESGFGISADDAGNTYVTGSFNDIISFGTTTLTPNGEDIFVAKYNNIAELQWVKKIGGGGSDRCTSIVVDNAGHSFISGWFGLRPFLAELDENGNTVWSSTFETTSTSTFNQIALKDDYIVVCGSFQGTITIGNSTFNATGNSDGIVAKFTKGSGLPVWAKSFGGQESQDIMGLAVSSSGNIYASGSTFGTITIGNTTLNVVGGLDAFVMKLNSNGDPVWAKSISGNSWENALSVALDGQDNPVVTGYFTNSVTIGTITLTGFSNEDIFVAKFSESTGGLIWTTKGGGSGYDHGSSIISDASGNLYITGYYESSASFGSIDLPNKTNSRDVFVAKYNSQGVLQWVKSAGGNESDGGEGVAVSPDGIVHVTGSYRTYSITLESTLTPNAGGDDVFIWKIWQ